MSVCSGEYDFGAALAGQMAFTKDRLTAFLVKAIDQEFNEMQQRLMLDSSIAIERTFGDKQSIQLEQVRTELAGLRADLAESAHSKLSAGLTVEQNGAKRAGKVPLHAAADHTATAQSVASRKAAEDPVPPRRRGAGATARKPTAEEEVARRKIAHEEAQLKMQAEKLEAQRVVQEEVPSNGWSEGETVTQKKSEAYTACMKATEQGLARVTGEEQRCGNDVESPADAEQQRLGSSRGVREPNVECPAADGRALAAQAALHRRDEPQCAQGATQKGARVSKEVAASRAPKEETLQESVTMSTGGARVVAQEAALRTELERAGATKGLNAPVKAMEAHSKLSLKELKAQMCPAHNDGVPSDDGARLWVVVGGEDSGGILVRKEQSLSSTPFVFKLARGTTVEELEVVGNRLHYKRIRGDGPDFGWVNLMNKEKPLLELDDESQ